MKKPPKRVDGLREQSGLSAVDDSGSPQHGLLLGFDALPERVRQQDVGGLAAPAYHQGEVALFDIIQKTLERFLGHQREVLRVFVRKLIERRDRRHAGP
ncbi:MAG: hypothetical protein EOO77_32815 [Oxalobacteraceae bacterium]|nr:MAG: hypothetical protein EOO77_32815 [Oxalobacteraceae bacterium]